MLTPNRAGEPREALQLAYLCNVYPAVSHSFVRREIEALEAAGHEIHRFSVRKPRAGLKDEGDLRESERTEVILSGGLGRLLLASLILVALRPRGALSGILAAMRLSPPGLANRLRHLVYLAEAAWLARRLLRLNVRHLHAHFGTNPAAVALLVSAIGGPSFSFTVHGPDEFDAPAALGIRQKVGAARFVVAISSFGKSQLMRWTAPRDYGKIHVIRCGVDSAYLEAPATPVPEESRSFFCVARLSAQKGLPVLIDACAKLRDRGARFTLTIAGDGDMSAELRAQVARLDLDGVVTFAGICTQSEIREHLLASRAFVLPSFAEGLPVVLMEALALSRPVITTAIAGIPELVDGNCGWLIPAGSADVLEAAMHEALESPAEDLTKKAAEGRGRVQHMHDAEANAASLARAISDSSREPAAYG